MKVSGKPKKPKKPKTYVLDVECKGQWLTKFVISYHYSKFSSVEKHIAWMLKKIAEQDSKDAIRKNIIVSFTFEEFASSKVRNKRHPPLATFAKPKAHGMPKGGLIGSPP